MPSERSEERSLPAISLLFLLLGNARSLILPLIAFLAWPQGLWFWLFLMLLPAVLQAVFHFATYRYRLDAEKVVVRQGLITRRVRNIPLDRIQNIDLVQNPLQRLLRVFEVRLETASGGKPEAVMRVLTEQQVQELRALLDARRNALRTAASEAAQTAEDVENDAAPLAAADLLASPHVEAEPLVQQTPAQLAGLGLLSDRAMLVVAAAFGFLHQSGVFDDPTRYDWLADRVPVAFETLHTDAWGPSRWLLTGAAVVILFFAITRLLSVLWTLVSLYGYRLEDRGDDLAASYGLLTRVNASLPKRRIQLLSIHHPWFGQPFKLTSTRVETAGGGASQDHQGPGAARLWLAPLLHEPELPALLTRVLPSVDRSQTSWRALADAAPRRLAKRNAIAVVIFALVTTAFAWPWGLFTFAIAPVAAWRGWRWAKRSLWGLAPATTDPQSSPEEAILFRSGAFGFHESLVPLTKIQCVSVRSTPFDRRWGMASLHVDTAGASANGHRIQIPYLDQHTAERLARTLTNRAASTTFHW